MSKPKVLLVGWDAADWRIINPLMDAGFMPALNALVNQGVIGNLASIQPMLSPMLWNSIATGKRPEKHGIFGFIEPDTATGGVRPVSSTSRHGKAIWNILSQQGFRTHVVGWFAGHPAEPVNGISVSDLFPYARGPLSGDWPVPRGAVHPESVQKIFAKFRVHPHEIGSDAILTLVPNASAAGKEDEWRLSALAKIIAETATIQNCATWILENEDWDFAAFYYNGIDHFCHGFMDCYPPHLPHISQETADVFAGVVKGAYRFHDMILDRLLQLTPPETTVILVSDHGFHSDHLRPRALPNIPAGPAAQHRQIGVIALRGPQVRRDARISGASILDITPTILSRFDLPVGLDMDGRVLVNAFEHPPEVRTISSWETAAPLPGMSTGMHSAEMRLDPDAARAVIEQFRALGYIEENQDQETAILKAVRELKFNRARALVDDRKNAEALPLLEALCSDWPEETRFREQLASCCISLGLKQRAKALLCELLALSEHLERQPSTSVEDAHAGTTVPEQIEISPQRLKGRSEWLMGQMLLEEGKREAALECFTRAKLVLSRLPELHVAMGGTFLRLGRILEAKESFSQVIVLDEDSAAGHLGLAQCHLRLAEFQEATDEALTSVGLQPFLPAAHFALGVALARLAMFDRAVVALETAVSIAPGMLNAHRMLLAIHNRPTGDKHKAAMERDMVLKLGSQRSRQSGAAHGVR